MQLQLQQYLEQPQPREHRPRRALENFLVARRQPHPSRRSNLYLVGIALLVGFGLWALYRYTRFGLATRAAAGNEKGAVLLGYSPEFLAATNWVIAAVVAGFAAIIVGPIGGAITPVAAHRPDRLLPRRHAHRRAELDHAGHHRRSRRSAWCRRSPRAG